MARATKVQETVVRREKVDRIRLTLTEGEADFLQAVLARVGGSKNSPRKYESRISKALADATGESSEQTDAAKLLRHSEYLHFHDYAPVPDAGANVANVSAAVEFARRDFWGASVPHDNLKRRIPPGAYADDDAAFRRHVGL